MSDRETSKAAASLAAGLLDVEDRRGAGRFGAAFDVAISKTHDAARRIATEAWVRDVSANGLGICCAQSFEVGDAATVRAPGQSLECEVRHCRAEGAMFSVGLEVLRSSDGTDIESSLRDLSKALHFSDRTRADVA